MKGLRKVLAPFAPDQSGAVSVLYELGGIIVICDAGGCAGNICGFDEPRWTDRRSAVFSAGLRDMDAILGRDDRLADKLADAAKSIEASFAAIIGTPVPAVIGTDYRGLARLAERRSGLPVIAIDCTGTRLYDVGAEKAYLSLLRRFAGGGEVVPGRIGVLGATPLDMSCTDAGDRIADVLRREGWREVFCYGMGAGLEEVSLAGTCEKNLVAAPSGLAAAEYLLETFGTPWEARDPLAAMPAADVRGKRVLVVHDLVRARTLAGMLRDAGAKDVDTGTWFSAPPALGGGEAAIYTEEDGFRDAVMKGGYDLLLADRDLWELVPDFSGGKEELTHYAVSGRLL